MIWRFTPNSGPAGGSRSNVLTGNATRVACENLISSYEKSRWYLQTYDEMIAENKAS